MSGNNSNGGVGFFGVLTIAFVVLKLTEVIAWSWWWVLAPIWIPITIALGLAVTIAWKLTGKDYR